MHATYVPKNAADFRRSVVLSCKDTPGIVNLRVTTVMSDTVHAMQITTSHAVQLESSHEQPQLFTSGDVPKGHDDAARRH